VAVKIFNVARSDKNDIITSVFRSKGALVGSSTMNNVMMPKIAGMLEELTGLRFRNKKAAAFGSYGWNGGAVDRVQTRLMDAGFETTMSLKANWRPDLNTLEECRQYGRDLARQWATGVLPAVSRPAAAAPKAITLQPVAVPAAAVNDTGKAKSCDSVTNVSSQDLGPCMQCGVCQWVYDPEKGEPVQGVEPGTPWSCVPDNFLCPECSLGKDVFDVLATEAA